jgi:hypothetical protein
MSEKRGNWLWNLLRGKGRKELDRLERDLIMRPYEKREYAGDPAQAEKQKIRLRQK